MFSPKRSFQMIQMSPGLTSVALLSLRHNAQGFSFLFCTVLWADVVIVSQLHCELPHLHCSQCLPSLSPLSLFPAPRRSVPHGLRNGHKKKRREKKKNGHHIQILTGSWDCEPSPNASMDRLKAHYCSPWSRRPIATFQAERWTGGAEQRVHCGSFHTPGGLFYTLGHIHTGFL